MVVLAEDDDSYAPSAGPPREEYAGHFAAGELGDRDREEEKVPEKMLFCGWRADMADIIQELDEDVPRGSELWLFNEVVSISIYLCKYYIVCVVGEQTVPFKRCVRGHFLF